jgi:alpha-aminoadipic semialdehyde synthase
VYTYLPDKDEIVDGVKGDGPVVLAVDNLPCEFPSNASCDFGDALMLFVEVIARADYSASFEQLDLPKHIKRAVIAHQGKLAPDYAYLEKHIEKIGGEF